MSENLQFNLNVNTGTAVSEINKFFQTFDQGAAQASNKLRKAFGEPLKTEVEISLKNGEIVAKKIESMNTNTGKVKSAYKALNGEIARTPAKLKKQMSILKELQGNTEKYRKGTNKLTAEWKKVEDRINKVKAAQDKLTGGGGGGQMDNFIGKFAMVQTMANLATAAILQLGRSVTDMVSQGVRLESLMLQLEAFTGGAQQARAAYEAFGETARKTPFNVEQVANAGKIMMAFGVDTATAVDMTDRLSIAAAATGGEINNLGRNLGQIAAQGQAYTRDLTQFAIQGLPIWEHMSEVTGKSVTELKKLASEGKISFEIVSAAIKNMTKDGSAFQEVAKRMQETFAGRLASIETSMANLALAAIEAFNKIDKATGGLITGAMKGFADFLQGLADQMPDFAEAVAKTFNDIGGMFEFAKGIFDGLKNIFKTFLGFLVQLADPLGIIRGGLDTVSKATKSLVDQLKPVETVMAALAGPAIVIGIGLVVKGIYSMVTATYAYIKAQITSLGLQGPTGWAILGAAALATAGAYHVLSGNLEEANEQQAKSEAAQKQSESTLNDLKTSTDAATNSQQDFSEQLEDTTAALKDQRDAAKATQAAAKIEYDEAKKASDALKASILQRIKEEKAANTSLIEQKKQAIQMEKDGYKQAEEAMKKRYSTEIERVSAVYDAKLRAINADIAGLEAMGPKEKELYDLNKAELEQKIKSADLSAKERLELEAQLERMNRQEQIQKLKNEAKEVEKNKTAEITRLEKEQEDNLEKLKTGHEAIVTQLNDEIEKIEDANDALDDQKDAIDKAARGVVAYNGNIDDGVQKLVGMLAQTNDLKGKWDNATAAVARYNAELAKTPKPSAPQEGKASGGPVSGGTTYTVNELGKEAFLSASGKLSMINAPAWGDWKAPSSGTVIPAHLTSQLNIPTGGININSGASANASRAGAGGMSAMVRAIQSSMGGDNISNSVTIQAVNPTQAASDMLVNLNRVRRRRYS